MKGFVMKNNKLIFSVALLAMLTLGACSSETSPSSSSSQGGVTSSQSSAPQPSSSSSSSEPHQHLIGQYGFCSCGEYLGGEYALEEGTATVPSSFLGDMQIGEKRFFRLSGLTEKHALHVEDYDGWDFAHETEIAADVTAYKKLDDGSMDELLIGFNTAEDEMTEEAIAFEQDKHIYFVVEAHKVLSDAFLYLVEDHFYNAAGVCAADGSFRANGTYDGYTWTSIPVGSESADGISHLDDGKAHYFKIVEDPNNLLPFAHHKFNLTVTNESRANYKLYYLDAENSPVELTLSEGNEPEVPAGVHALYVVVTHNGINDNASFQLRRVEHCREEHGYCPDCELVTLPLSKSLTMNAEFSSEFAVVEGQKYSFYFDFNVGGTNVENFGIQFTTSPWSHFASSFWLYVYDDVNEEFTLVYRANQSTEEIEYDLSDVYYGPSLAFFEFTAADTISDVQIRVHDYE